MNQHYNDAVYKLGEANAMLSAIEGVFDDLDLLPDDREKVNRAAFLFYAAWDAVKKAGEELDNYSAECRIVNVIQATRKAHEI